MKATTVFFFDRSEMKKRFLASIVISLLLLLYFSRVLNRETDEYESFSSSNGFVFLFLF